VHTACEVRGVREGRVIAAVGGQVRQEFSPGSILSALGRRSVNSWVRCGSTWTSPCTSLGTPGKSGTLHDVIWEGALLGRTL